MLKRGVSKVQCVNLFDNEFKGSYDTILLLMNGTGIAGKICNLPQLFKRLKELLSPDGQILIERNGETYNVEGKSCTINRR